jgi:diaminopimelate decarboxylase
MIKVEGNELQIAGIPATELVQEFGEPLYVYDAGVAEAQFGKLRAAMPGTVDIMYSMKANPNAALVGFLGARVDGIEVSSLGELHVAEQAGISPQRIIFVGPSKSDRELTVAVRKQIRCIVAESEQELEIIEQIGSELGLGIDVALRVNPAFDSAGSKLKMGGAPRQFGVDEEQSERILRKARAFRYASVAGIHVYLGTRILDYSVVLKNTREVLLLARRLQDALGAQFRLVDFGGGIGVPYFAGEAAFNIEALRQELAGVIEDANRAFPMARFILESGRYLVADCGVYITRVRYVKHSRGQRFVLVGGGMNHHMATTSIGTLVKNNFPIEALTKMDMAKAGSATVCGPLCTPSDVLAKSVELPEVQRGDLLGILRSGAYGVTASPVDFLSHEHPAEVLAYQGRAHLVRRKSSMESILDDQVIADLTERCVGAEVS